MIYLVIATVCFSLSFGLIKDQLSVLPSEFVVFCRLLVAALIFLPFFRKLTLKKHITAMIIGVIQFGIMYFAFIKAFKFLQGNEIAVLTTTTPVFVAIWSCIFGERFKFVYILCILMSVFGAGIIVWHNMTFNMIVKGVLLMETCNCSFALGQVLWKKYLGGCNKDVNLMAAAYFGGFLFILPFALFNVDFASISLTKGQIFSLLYLSVIPTGIGFWLWNKGAERVKYSTLAVMNNLKIPLGVLFSILFFGEKINLLNFTIGITVILSAIILLQYVLKR